MELIVYAGCAVSLGCVAWAGFASVRHRSSGALIFPLICLMIAGFATMILKTLGDLFPGPVEFVRAVGPLLGMGMLMVVACSSAFGLGVFVASMIKPQQDDTHDDSSETDQ